MSSSHPFAALEAEILLRCRVWDRRWRGYIRPAYDFYGFHGGTAPRHGTAARRRHTAGALRHARGMKAPASSSSLLPPRCLLCIFLRAAGRDGGCGVYQIQARGSEAAG